MQIGTQIICKILKIKKVGWGPSVASQFHGFTVNRGVGGLGAVRTRFGLRAARSATNDRADMRARTRFLTRYLPAYANEAIFSAT